MKLIAAEMQVATTPALVATIAGFGASGRMLVAPNAVFAVLVDSFETI